MLFRSPGGMETGPAGNRRIRRALHGDYRGQHYQCLPRPIQAEGIWPFPFFIGALSRRSAHFLRFDSARRLIQLRWHAEARTKTDGMSRNPITTMGSLQDLRGVLSLIAALIGTAVPSSIILTAVIFMRSNGSAPTRSSSGYAPRVRPSLICISIRRSASR